MTGDELPDSDHVARYCSPRLVVDRLPILEAFVPQPVEAPLSVVWVEYFGDPQDTATFDKLRGSVGAHLVLRQNGRFAVINVGRAKGAMQSHPGQSFRIQHAPLEDFPSHAAITGLISGTPRRSRALQRLVSESDMYMAVVESDR